VNETGPEGPRFCGLKHDANNFDCRWEYYADQIANREVGFLVFAGIGLAVSCIFGVIIVLCCCECIFKKGGRLNKMARMEDGDLDNGKGRRRDRFRFLLVIPFAIVICGAVPLFIGNIRLTETWNDAGDFVRDQRDSLLILKREIVTTLENFPGIHNTPNVNVTDLKARLEVGVKDMEGSFKDFLEILDSSSLIRTIVTWFITVGMLTFCLFGFIFLVKKAPKALLLLLVLINFCVFLTIIDFAVHSSMKIAGDDICAEIPRPNGMFYLWQRRALVSLERMRSAANDAFDTMTVFICNTFRTLCSAPYQVCGNYPCHKGNVFTDLGNVSLIDQDASIRTWYTCAASCANSNMQTISSTYVQSRQVRGDFTELERKIIKFIDNLSGEVGSADLDRIFCGLLDESLSYVYGGCAVLLIGELAEMALLFWLGY
jgi:hypothetical protein